MYKSKHKILISLAVISACLLTCLSITGCKKEEPAAREEPAVKVTPTAEPATLTADNFADAVEAYILKRAARADGYYTVFDDKTGRQLKLTLDRVHRKRLAKVSQNLYYTCADFIGADDEIYDLDFFMRGTHSDDLAFSKFLIHKVGDQKRYQWYIERGLWKRKPIETIEEKPAMPEPEAQQPESQTETEQQQSESQPQEEYSQEAPEPLVE